MLNTIISKKTHIDKNFKIGNFSKIHDNVFIGKDVTIDDYCIIGYPTDSSESKLFIGDGSHIRSHTIIYSGSKFKSKLETGHHVLIRENTIVGENLRIGSFSDIEGDCKIGDYTRLHSYVHVGKGSKIGNFVWIYSLVTLTNDPLPPSHIERPVTIEDGVVITVNSTILPGILLRMGTFVGASTVVNRTTKIGEVLVNSATKTSNLTVKNLFDLKSKTQHPWMNHFYNAYPEISQERILDLKNKIYEQLKREKYKHVREA